ncbi:hypothetical protein N7463_004177 [Penicillium fimorum]|uniref:Uncharacterized protein n=1 Tax=Penicillium fimorum TaxID=1882269 RepID=A0A9X0CAN7_9EURO|nr:hypothetical protein N7463_004177 [Penicillium fimorum]
MIKRLDSPATEVRTFVELYKPPPPPPPEETPTLQHIQGVLEHQQTAEVQSVNSTILRLTRGPENNPVTVTNSSGGECELQYMVQFLAAIEQKDSPSRDRCTHIRRWLYPLHLTDSMLAPPMHLSRAQSCEHYIVLDKPAFVQEPGVLFNILWTDPRQYIEPQSTDTVIETLRSAGIQEATRRLAMLPVEEKIQICPRKLTREEHREFLSLSPEYEQKMNF